MDDILYDVYVIDEDVQTVLAENMTLSMATILIEGYVEHYFQEFREFKEIVGLQIHTKKEED